MEIGRDGLLAAALECTTAEAEAAAERLAKRYEADDRGVHLLRLENAWQLGTKREFYDALIRVAKEPRRQVLSQVVLETLAIIAYRQPVTKMEISKIPRCVLRSRGQQVGRVRTHL